MSGDGAVTVVALAVVMAGAGALLGMVYFRALRRTADAVVDGGWSRAVVFTVARIALAVALFAAAARFGPVPLLAAFAGFLAARVLAVRMARREG
ncbi:MAG: hypothetical protein GC201_01890 [Alphaproteobacteria bacterium]|nr:hypothetical protein [Alphaproteobacteria bacterium]